MKISLVDMDSSNSLKSNQFLLIIYFSFSTHFLTGDGGFIQSVMMGYAGLRYDSTSLLFNPIPGVLTPASQSIRLRNVLVRGKFSFDYTIDQQSLQFICSPTFENLICITDRQKKQWKINTNPLILNFKDIHLPIRVDLCDN